MANSTGTRKAKQPAELQALLDERDAAFKKQQQAKEAMGMADNALHSAKQAISEYYRRRGARG